MIRISPPFFQLHPNTGPAANADRAFLVIFMKRLFMKKFMLLASAIMLTLAGLRAQSEAEMKAWQEFMTPGSMHQMMARFNGEWNEDITHWMQPGAEGMKSNASCVNTMILGGRYQESRHTGSFFGMPFEGLSWLGYDNGKKLFVSTWIDNMGSGIATMEGPWDEKTKTIDLRGKATDPMTGKDVPMRQVFKIIDDHTQVVEMYGVYQGKEFKNMEIRLTRKN